VTPAGHRPRVSSSSDDPLWLFADQLGPHVHSTDEHRHRRVVLVESERVLRRRRWHRQKVHVVLSGMRHLADELGERAVLLRTGTYRAALAEVGRPVVVHEPTSHAAAALVARLHDEGLVSEVLPAPTFALPRADFAMWAGDQRSFRMEQFYRDQRRRFDVLMDGDEPVGGRWNYDHDNREPPPKAPTLGLPAPWQPAEDDIDAQVRRDIDRMGLDTVGADGPRRFAVARAEAEQALESFVAHRLPRFGPHEDAMLAADPVMAHSMLSVPLNLGLLHPLENVHAAEAAYRGGDVPLASAEGYIRQVLGWREYMWQLYWHFGPDYLDRNELQARAPLPGWWTELDSDAVTARCLRTALEGVRERGWTHHIERLMILGNHALQRGYDPRALSDWFRETFVDGFEWVMPPNVIGMSQHADGGLLATKPYAAGGAYVNRMSDYCHDCRFNPRVRLGDDACPYTAGYWAWIHRHRDRLAANQRTRRAVAGMDRLADLDAVLEQEAAREGF
jgi:deoxyribodipyrimidine photolyase-related protein